MSNVLDLADQGIFLSEQATGATALVRCVWVYDRPIDVDGLRRFHRHLQRGPLSRRIEQSRLPFGRHRWVSPSDAPGLQLISTPLRREDFDAWLIEHAHTSLDAEHGPGWHLAAVPFSDGGAGVSLVISHSLTDAIGLCEALVEAVRGRDSSVIWPAPGSRRRWQALREDVRQTARDTPAMARAVMAAARLARNDLNPTEPAGPPSTHIANERVTLPMATFFVDAEEWDSRAYSLGGTSNSLLVGIAGRLAQRLGRVAADGSIALAMPVNERTPGDTRANAVTNVDLRIYPAPATMDLREIRAAIKNALIRHREMPSERLALLPLIPLTPKRLARRMVGVAAGGPTCVVSSHLGEIDPAATRVDGTAADYFVVQSLFPSVTAETVHRAGGRLGLISGRVHGRVFVSVLAYQAGTCTTESDLQRAVASTLADFSLTATTGWRCRESLGRSLLSA